MSIPNYCNIHQEYNAGPSVVRRDDVFVSFPMGYGKNLCFVLLFNWLRGLRGVWVCALLCVCTHTKVHIHTLTHTVYEGIL